MWRVACREARKQVASLTHGPACRGAHGAPAPGGPYPLHSLAHAAPPTAATPHHARLIPSLVVAHGPASLATNAKRIGAWRHASPLALTLTSPSLSALRSALTHSSASLSSATLSAAASLPAAARASLAVPAAGAAAGRAAGVSVWKHYGRCYYELSKTRLSLLVVATAAAGFVMGSDDRVDWAGLGWTSLGTFLAAASANTWNQVYEVANDALMKRTRGRPLPAGRMTRQHAIAWGLLTGASGLAILATQTNSMTAGLGAANIALYAGVYTPLKQLHIANTWVGAVVGAIPPLMGWAAASGGLDAGAAVLAGALYLWQMPHFLALAWLCRKDYAAGGYRMLSLADPTGRRTAAAALRNCCYMLPLGLAAVSRAPSPPSPPSPPSLPLHPFMPCSQYLRCSCLTHLIPHPSHPSPISSLTHLIPHPSHPSPISSLTHLIPHPSHPLTFSLHTSFPPLTPTSFPPSLTVGCTTAPFLWENVLLTGAFTAAAVPFYRSPSSASARQLFRASLLFLPALMAAMLLHRLPHHPLPAHALSPAPAPTLTHAPLPSHAPAVMAGAGESGVGGATAGEQGAREEVEQKAWGEAGARRAWEAAGSGERGESRRRASLPPVAYYSAAPFPFLPVPHYA
ncbi:unnamed protein product [Closterium sp. NIES-65]|nr:unnamed protein product [Closterium sp. NIES-65]